MDWKRSLALSGLVFLCLGAKAAEFGEVPGTGEIAPSAPSPAPPSRYVSPLDPELCLLGARRFGCGMHPLKKRMRMHNGWDMAARPRGTPDLRAIGNGTVIEAGPISGACGQGVKVRLENGLIFIYCHMSKIAPGLKTGSKVTAEQVVGKMGNSGKSKGIHLHFVLATCEDPEECAIDPALHMDANKMCRQTSKARTSGQPC